jgi:hypothetical protein
MEIVGGAEAFRQGSSQDDNAIRQDDFDSEERSA